jgi:predicted negative regulator of RcsB-dependent stress response
LKNIRVKTGKSKFYDEPDRFLSFSEKVKVSVMENPSQAYGALIAVGLVIAITVIAAIMIEAKKDQVTAIQAEGFAYYDVLSPSPTGEPLPEAERYQEASDIFANLAEKGSGGGSGLIGNLYLANAEYKLGNVDNALEGYRSLHERRGNTIMGTLAGFRVADVLLEKGDMDAAYEVVTKLADNAAYMRDEALYMKAWLGELMGKDSESGAAYSKITTEYPDSPRKREASAKLNRMMEAEMAQQSEQPAPEAPAAQ